MAGKVGNALAFDGADDTVEIADNSNLSPVKEITIDAWVQPDVLSGLHNIYRRDVDGNRILLSFQSGGNCADGGFLPRYLTMPGFWNQHNDGRL